ncbi:MAG: AAA family ATPase [Candidatus Marsarchaeota archaeon]|nr:AAA family ATPase [Candidatus Marsarchaeota archaeon]MCL5102016.1 AAA family ATPase [Candidatus Marsarchaeota archaeon]
MAKSKNVLILVLGSPGAGKTTLIKSMAESDSESRFKVINIGTLMAEEVESENIPRDKLRYLPTSRIKELRKRAFGKIAAMKGTVIVDTHATVEKGNKFIFGLPINDLQYMGTVQGIIYVDASPEELIKRRSSDTVRKRENDDEEVLNLQRQLNLSVVTMYGSMYDIPVYILHNKENGLKQASLDFKSFVEDIIKNSEYG